MNSPDFFATKARNTRKKHILYTFVFVAFVFSWPTSVQIGAIDEPRQIVQEAQRRTDSTSQRYEGLLQVLDAKGKVSDKRWTLERLGSHGNSKMVLRFTV